MTAKKKATKKKAAKAITPSIQELMPATRGRPTMYDPKYCEEITEYFNVEPYKEVERFNEKTEKVYFVKEANDLPTMAGFATQIGVSKQTLYNWGRVHPDFFDSLTRAIGMCERMLVTNTLNGLFNPHFAVFVAKNYTDMRDVKDLNVNIEHEHDKPRTVSEIQAAIAKRDEQIKILEAQL